MNYWWPLTDYLFLLREKQAQSTAKFVIAKLFSDTGAGLADGGKITFIFKNTRMQRPLPATPWSCLMHAAPPVVIIKNTMSINGFHLDNFAGNAPETSGNLFPGHVQLFNHPSLVIVIKGNRCLTLTAVTTTGTLK